jgi:hypothetical protein
VDNEYFRQHRQVYKARGKASQHVCEHCKGKTALDWALVHGQDGNSPSSYISLCRSCHVIYDDTPERREKIAAAATGRSYSPETRVKISAAATSQWASGNRRFFETVASRRS